MSRSDKHSIVNQQVVHPHLVPSNLHLVALHKRVLQIVSSLLQHALAVRLQGTRSMPNNRL